MAATKKSVGFRVATAVLCDDVRQEISNKLILIGVYTHDILVQQFPAQIALALYAEIWFEEEGEKDLAVTYVVDGDERGGMKAQLLVRDAKEPFILTMPQLPVQILKAGQLEVRATFGTGKPISILRRAVKAAG